MALFDKLLNRKPSPAAFAKLVEDELKKAGTSFSYAFEADEFRLRDGAQYVNLHNIYKSYCAAPGAERAALAAEFALSLVETEAPLPDDFASARDQLMPMLRWPGETSFEALRAHVALKNIDRSIGINAVPSIVFDLPNAIRRVPYEKLTEWGASEDDVWAAAMRNLRFRSVDSFEEIAPGLYRSTWSDVFDATRILLPDLIHRVPVAGEPLVMIPERNVLLVAGSRDEAAIAALVKVGLEAYDDSPYALMPDVIEMDGEGWRSRRVAPPLQQQIDGRIKVDLHSAYEQQKALLEDDLVEQIFVQPVFLYKSKTTGTIRTATNWDPTIPALVPEADLLGFASGDPEDPFVVAEWDQALSIFGPFLREPDLYPPRYRIDPAGFPEKLAQLRRLRTEL